MDFANATLVYLGDLDDDGATRSIANL